MLLKERVNLSLAILMLFMHFILPYAAQAENIPDAEHIDSQPTAERSNHGPNGRFFVPEGTDKKEDDEFLEHLPDHIENQEDEHDIEEQVELSFNILSLLDHHKMKRYLLANENAHLLNYLQPMKTYSKAGLWLALP